MPNFIKRVEKFADNKLMDGEKVQLAVFLQQKGSLTQATAHSALGLIGAILNIFHAKKNEQQKENTASPLTKQLPQGTMVIAATDKRVLVYKHKELGAKIESFATEYRRGDIIKMEIKSWLIMSTITLHFKDGGSVMLEAVMGQKLHDFSRLVTGM